MFLLVFTASDVPQLFQDVFIKVHQIDPSDWSSALTQTEVQIWNDSDWTFRLYTNL